MQKQIKITADGSPTIYVSEIDEHYHSVHGAVNESMHVYINHGFNESIRQYPAQLNILEIGLGTGLNLLLTYRAALQHHTSIYYHALEPFPLDQELIARLNYTQSTDLSSCQSAFEKIHSSPFHETTALSDHFIFFKSMQRLEEIEFDLLYDLVYFDAFGPPAQPEIWSAENFKKLFHVMKPNGILVTYCSKGGVRRTMAEAGFAIEKLQGPQGKREMVRAKKLV